jgi:3-deoxy-manno-octulosonate cytidylyltransferase (CMP-KDO synthetase)
MQLRTLGVIPARYGAQRFPGKPLALIAGQPLIQRVYDRARQAKRLDRVVVATDDERIRSAVEKFGGAVVMTSPACPSGTDRAAEVARQSDAELIVNIQGDEPLLRPEMIDQLVEGMLSSPVPSPVRFASGLSHPMGAAASAASGAGCVMATLARAITDPAEVANPNVVKVVFGVTGRALYFSRCPIPFNREPATHYKHIGIYAYRREFLLQYVQMPPSPLERTEKLEQLRALENGYPIQVLVTPFDSIGVDVPADVQRVEEILRHAS